MGGSKSIPHPHGISQPISTDYTEAEEAVNLCQCGKDMNEVGQVRLYRDLEFDAEKLAEDITDQILMGVDSQKVTITPRREETQRKVFPVENVRESIRNIESDFEPDNHNVHLTYGDEFNVCTECAIDIGATTSSGHSNGLGVNDIGTVKSYRRSMNSDDLNKESIPNPMALIGIWGFIGIAISLSLGVVHVGIDQISLFFLMVMIIGILIVALLQLKSSFNNYVGGNNE